MALTIFYFAVTAFIFGLFALMERKPKPMITIAIYDDPKGIEDSRQIMRKARFILRVNAKGKRAVQCVSSNGQLVGQSDFNKQDTYLLVMQPWEQGAISIDAVRRHCKGLQMIDHPELQALTGQVKAIDNSSV